MCRNIRTLHHFEPPATHEEVEASALQYVRKLTGMHEPSKANQKAFDAAVRKITDITEHLFDHLEVHTPPRSWEEEKRKAKERGEKREAALKAKYGGRSGGARPRLARAKR
jgi:hypothetical protein